MVDQNAQEEPGPNPLQDWLDRTVLPSVEAKFEALTANVVTPEQLNGLVTKSDLQAVGLDHDSLVQRVNALEDNVGKEVAAAGEVVVTRVVSDQWLDRALAIIGTVGAFAAGLTILVFYFNGNPQAGKIADGAGLVLGPAVAYIIKRFMSPKAAVPVSSLPSHAAPTTSVTMGTDSGGAVNTVTSTTTSVPTP